MASSERGACSGVLLQGSCMGAQCGQWTFMCSHACQSPHAHAMAPTAPVMPGYPHGKHLYNQHDLAAGRV